MKKLVAIALLGLAASSVFASALSIENQSPFQAKYPLFDRTITYSIQFQNGVTVDQESPSLNGSIRVDNDATFNVVDKNGQPVTNYVADIKFYDSHNRYLGAEHIENGQATFNIAMDDADTDVLRSTAPGGDGINLKVKNWYSK